MSEKKTIANLISQAAKRLHDDFDYIRDSNPHGGEKGGETEDAVRKFLNNHMPKRFHATGGFVIDTDNQMSDHQDVIIYDALSSPVYRYEGTNEIVSADAVASVIEVKSVLNSSHLENGYKKVAEVKRLKKRPVGNMDQNPTQGSLMTTATLGIVLGFESAVDLDTLAKHCVELNKEYEYAHRPDMIVVLDVGVINYVAQFFGARQAGDLAPACDEEFVIPPCYVHLVSRADGAFALNRLWAQLLSHLAFYPRRPSIPDLSVLLEGTSTVSHHLGIYQFNTERRLVEYEQPEASETAESIIKLRSKATKKELATLSFIPWQDGGVIRKKGQIPLLAVLALVLGKNPMTVPVGDTELSMVEKITRPEFEKWPAIIERQSDMTATLEAPPAFEVQRLEGVEGTAEPFVARLFLGLLSLAQNAFPAPADKAQFDERFHDTLMSALSMRRSFVSAEKLLRGHVEALKSETIVRKKGTEPQLTERIDNTLRSYAVNFIEMANSVLESLPVTMKAFEIPIDYLLDREERFTKGCERYEKKYPELIDYLRKLRPTVLRVKDLFKRMRFGGWSLPSVRYDVIDGVQVMIEPQIDGSDLSVFMKGLLSVLGLAIEDLVAYGFQREMKGAMVIGEIPLDKRGPQNAQRFRMVMRGSDDWQLKWTGKSFYES